MRFSVSFAVSRLSSCFLKIMQSCWRSLEYARNSKAVHVPKYNRFASKNKTPNHHPPPIRVDTWTAEETKWTFRRVRLESPNFAILVTDENDHRNNVITGDKNQSDATAAANWTNNCTDELPSIDPPSRRFTQTCQDSDVPRYRLEWLSTSQYPIGKPRHCDLSNLG